MVSQYHHFQCQQVLERIPKGHSHEGCGHGKTESLMHRLDNGEQWSLLLFPGSFLLLALPRLERTKGLFVEECPLRPYLWLLRVERMMGWWLKENQRAGCGSGQWPFQSIVWRTKWGNDRETEVDGFIGVFKVQMVKTKQTSWRQLHRLYTYN